MAKASVKLRAIHQLDALRKPLPEDGRGWPAGAVAVEMRDLPFPFSNYASLSNDCDTITVKFDEVGLAFSYIRETLGLPIADSFFPDLVCTGQPVRVRFKGPQPLPASAMDITATRMRELSGEYVRKFHQGWFDSVHGFALAVCAKLPVSKPEAENEALITPAQRDPRPLNRRKVHVVAVGNEVFPLSMRFRFMSPEGWRTPRPPRYLLMRLAAPRGPQTVRIALWVKDELRADLLGAPPVPTVPVCTSQDYLLDLWDAIGLDVEALHNVEVEVTAVGPDGSYVEIEDIAVISHITADLDRVRRLLGIYNMTTAVFTSHGLGLVLTPNAAFDREAADTLRLADYPGNPHYAVDVFRDQGIRFINSYSNTSIYSVLHIDDLTSVNVLSNGEPFYDFPRHSYMPLDPQGQPDTGRWKRNGRVIDHSLNDCLGAKITGLLTELSGKRGHGGLVYTHLYARNKPAPDDDPAIYIKPFNAESRTSLAELSNRYYNATGSVGQADRLFIATVATLVRLSAVRSQIAAHSFYDPLLNEVHIESWVDEVLNERTPESRNAWRELRGLTFYVRDSHTARVVVDGEELHALIRNPPDETGRESVTISDQSAPLLIVGRLDLRRTNTKLQPHNATIAERPAEAIDASGLKLILSAETGGLTIEPPGVNAANYQSLLIETQRSNSASRFILKVRFTTGFSVVISEGNGADAKGFILKPWADTTPRVSVVPFYLLFQGGARDMNTLVASGPGLGSIVDIHLEVRGKPGDEFRIDRLALLRDSETLVTAEGAILGGHIPDAARVERVVLKDRDRRYESKPTAKGHYFFEHKVPRGAVVEIYAETKSGAVIEPMNGRLVEIATDKTDVDF